MFDIFFGLLGVVLLVAIPLSLRRLVKQEQATDRSPYNPNYNGIICNGFGTGLY
jgi:hypothetical protein